MMNIESLSIEDNPGDVELTRESLYSGNVGNSPRVAMDGEEILDYLFQHARSVSMNGTGERTLTRG